MTDQTTPPIKPLRMWATINTKTGAITQVGRTRKEAAQGYRYLTFTGMRRQVRVVVTADAALIDRLRRIESAARDYFAGYMQDEAESPEVCVTREQHHAARELKEALGNG